MSWRRLFVIQSKVAVASAALEKEWQSEVEKKNDKINALTASMERVAVRLEEEMAERQRVHETMAVQSVQSEQSRSRLEALR